MLQKRLAHLEHARREFIANASHELRTPLFALAGLLELLDDEELDDETRREFLSTAREQSDRLTITPLPKSAAKALFVKAPHTEWRAWA